MTAFRLKGEVFQIHTIPLKSNFLIFNNILNTNNLGLFEKKMIGKYQKGEVPVSGFFEIKKPGQVENLVFLKESKRG